MADETDMNASSNETHETTEAAEAAATEETATADEATETPSGDGAPKKPVTVERVADTTLGVGVVTVEALDRAARALDATVRRFVEDAPGVLAELEEKGRPVREKIAEAFRGRPTVSDIFSTAGAPSSSATNADEISALEDRVRELEQQVGGEPAPSAPEEPSPFSMLEIDPPAEAPAPEPEPESEAPKGRSRRKTVEETPPGDETPAE